MKQILIIFALSLALVLGLIACTGGDPAGSGSSASIAVELTWGEGSAISGNPNLCWATSGFEKSYTFKASITDDTGCEFILMDVEWCFDYDSGACFLGDLFTCDTSGAWLNDGSAADNISVDFFAFDDPCFFDGTDYFDGPYTAAVRLVYECSASTDLLVIIATASSSQVCPVGSGCTTTDSGCP